MCFNSCSGLPLQATKHSGQMSLHCGYGWTRLCGKSTRQDVRSVDATQCSPRALSTLTAIKATREPLEHCLYCVPTVVVPIHRNSLVTLPMLLRDLYVCHPCHRVLLRSAKRICANFLQKLPFSARFACSFTVNTRQTRSELLRITCPL